MAVLRPRTRLIYARISEDEFQHYSTLCHTCGARSMSHLIRSALQNLSAKGENGMEKAISNRLESIQELIFEMRAKLQELASPPNQQLGSNGQEQHSTTEASSGQGHRDDHV